MKKGTRIFWIVVASLFAVGLGLSVIGVLAGGGDDARAIIEERESRAEGISKYVHLMPGENGGPYIGTVSDDDDDDDDWDDDDADVKKQVIKAGSRMKVCGVSEVSELSFKLSAGDFRIEPAEGDDIELLVSGKMKATSSVSGRKLTVRTKVKKNRIIGDAGALIIYLPEKQYDELKIDLGAGELTAAAGLAADDISIEVGAGSVKAKEIFSKEFEAEIGAGSLTASKITAEKMDLDISMGDCQVETADAGEIRVNVGMGDADVGIAGSEADTSYDAECGMGELRIGSKKIEGVGNSHHGDAHHDESHEEHGSAGAGARHHVDAKCGMGDIHIWFHE